MGYSKKLYNVLGGYKCIIAEPVFLVNTKVAQTLDGLRYFFVNIKQTRLQTLLW